MNQRTLTLAIVIAWFATGITNKLSAQEPDRIVLWERNYHNPFFLAVIENAAELTRDDYGDFTISPSLPLEQGRAFVSMPEGKLLNVAIAGISTEHERLAKVVYIPIDRGLLGFRICITHAGHTGFEKVTSLLDFRKQGFTMGVGSHWPDRAVLESSGVSVAHSPVYEHLFDMLGAGRFDCFLRSVNEVGNEIKQFNKNNDLTINSDIAFVYPMADFVHISPAEPRLHARLGLGLERSLEDGSFHRLFNQYLEDALQQYQFYSRKIIVLKNADISINALDAINLHGIASFAQSYVAHDNTNDED